MSARPALGTFLRDIGSWVVGCFLLAKQAGIGFPPPAEVSNTMVIGAIVMVAGPGVLTILGAIFGGTGTGSPSPGSPPPALPGSSSGAPGTAGEPV